MLEPSRSCGLQFEIHRVKHKVGKEPVQYRGPVIWNFINRLVNFKVHIQKESFKNIIRRLSVTKFLLFTFSLLFLSFLHVVI